MKLRYAGKCRLCGLAIPAGTGAIYERSSKTVRCLVCPEVVGEPEPTPKRALVDELAPTIPTPESTVAPSSVPTPTDEARPPVAEIFAGQAGASARREYERRKAKGEQRMRDRFGCLAPIALAIRDERQTTVAWERGAVGEEKLGKTLDSLAEAGFVALHDRLVPGKRSNIDHIVIGPAGIWVVDAKRYKGRVELRIEGGIIRPVEKTLIVGRRDCEKLVDGMLYQMQQVQGAVPGVRVHGVLCFVEADWPLIGGSFTHRGVEVLWPRKLKKDLLQQTEGSVDVDAVVARLAKIFKSA